MTLKSMAKSMAGDFVGIPLEASLRSYDAKKVSDDTAKQDSGEVSLVQQQFGAEVDINNIVRRFGLTGDVPFAGPQGVYGDFSGITDYESALAKIEGANDRFMKLPAEVRDKFENNPGTLIRLANELDAKEFGKLLEPPAPVVPPAVP